MFETLKILSANCRGIQESKKRYDVINYFKEKNPGILCLQDTHLTNQDLSSIKNIWGYESILHGKRTNARGVAILINNTFEYKIEDIQKDNEGNYLIIDMKLPNFSIKLVNIYGPNTDDPAFYNNINNIIQSNTQDYVIICGDLNLTLNPKIDSCNYLHINNPRSRQTVLNLINDNELTDLFRKLHPNAMKYTWQQKAQGKKARLDYFIASNSLTDLVQSCVIKPGYRSDHSCLELNIVLNSFERGKGTFKFNCKLLKNNDYLNIVNKVIIEEKVKYAVPIYNLDNIKNVTDDIFTTTVDDGLFLDTLLLRIRGETIKFASQLKKRELNQEKILIKEIEILENKNNIQNEIIEDKKSELENIRQVKMEGHRIRSRLQWLSDGEKPSKFFCALERKNYIDKTVQKLTRPNGDVIHDQKLILEEMRLFYSKLFSSRDNDIANPNLFELFQDTEYQRLDRQTSTSLEGPLGLEEISIALKNMKNNKTPGLDGFPAEFFKVFWSKLKWFILKAINSSYDRELLPISLRQCLISCLPKGNKPRDNLKNWRPISLLNVIYKIASAAVANRIKPVLDSIIAKTQTGFIAGRYIGDTTRLIYDIMDFTENNNIPGLLVLIDFEKAFDSISWKFIYKVMHFLGFGEQMIKWIKTFNNDIKAYVIQAGFLSEPLKIERGCRQGDPIAPYLFLLCAQILFLLIEKNKDIKGIFINNKEYKLSQFADDTTLLLDGSRESLRAALNTLEIFGSMSGLKVNTEKTKLIWIGRMKHSKDKIQTDAKLEWGITEFTLLGIKYSVNIQNIPRINYESCYQKIKNILKNWKNRNLTPLGKISVLKTFIISNFNHLFQSLPLADENFMKLINTEMYNFVWDDKPDKVSRDQLTQDYLKGGLKMINIREFAYAQKTTWMRRLLKNNGALWINLFGDTICDIQKIAVFGPMWYTKLNAQLSNQFWKDTFKCWVKVCEKLIPQNNSDILYTTVWYNSAICKDEMYYPKLYNKGIHVIGDLIDENWEILNINELREKFGLANINFLHYLKLKIEIRAYIRKYKKPGVIHISYPYIPTHISILLKNNKGSVDMYNLLNNKTFNTNYKSKWNNDLNLINCDQNYLWNRVFKACFKTIDDNYIKWIQYRIIHRILGTNHRLFILGIANSNLCQLCQENDQTILHLFATCPMVIPLWVNLKEWIENKINVDIAIDNKTKILGYLDNGKDFKFINMILMYTRSYIFLCAKTHKRPIIYDLQIKLKEMFNEQQYVAKANNTYEKNNNHWVKWNQIFIDI